MQLFWITINEAYTSLYLSFLWIFTINEDFTYIIFDNLI